MGQHKVIRTKVRPLRLTRKPIDIHVILFKATRIQLYPILAVTNLVNEVIKTFIEKRERVRKKHGSKYRGYGFDISYRGQ